MPTYSLHTDMSEFYAQLQGVRSRVRRIERTLEVVGMKIVAWLKSTSPEYGMQPPVRAGEGPREAHPGHWADRSTHLRDGYAYKVIKRGGGYVLRFSNHMEYAVYLDEREGYFVLKGVADHADAPAVRELEKALRLAFPEFRVSVR